MFFIQGDSTQLGELKELIRRDHIEHRDSLSDLLSGQAFAYFRAHPGQCGVKTGHDTPWA